MTASAFVTAADVRGYLSVTTSTGPYSDANLGSNIRAASAFLERRTNRQFTSQLATSKTFTTNGAASISIPDATTITSVTLQGAALVTDASFWGIRDLVTNAYTDIQFRAFGGGNFSYLSNPEWFDRGLDLPGGSRWSSLPNDLVVVADWGYTSLPDELLHATKVLAGWYAKRPDSVLADTAVTPDGTALNYGALPPEVREFIGAWHRGPVAVVVG